MTTNQTIDAVPREQMICFPRELGDDLAELIANKARVCGGGAFDIWEAICEQFGTPATQPQGEPVAYLDLEKIQPAGMAYATKMRVNHRQTPLYAEQPAPVAPFQSRVQPWMLACFGEAIAADRQERNHRFLEEALELVQANQCTASEAHQLVDYVYGRPVGEPSQEVGGVMVTLAALCLASGLDMHAAGETELARIWTKVEQIRAKQATKPSMSPLPGAYPDREQPAPVAVVPEQTYRLLGDGDVIMDGDETLNDDTATWGKVPMGVFIGMPYNRRVMLPVRRAKSR